MVPHAPDRRRLRRAGAVGGQERADRRIAELQRDGRVSITVAAGMHLRAPSIDRGVTSFLWALGLGLFVFLGLMAIGIARPTAFILAALAFGAIFLFVRLAGEDAPTPR